MAFWASELSVIKIARFWRYVGAAEMVQNRLFLQMGRVAFRTSLHIEQMGVLALRTNMYTVYELGFYCIAQIHKYVVEMYEFSSHVAEQVILFGNKQCCVSQGIGLIQRHGKGVHTSGDCIFA